MNPQTVAYLEEGSFMQMDTTQIAGVDSTRRDTKIVCGKGAEALVTERLMTHGHQHADPKWRSFSTARTPKAVLSPVRWQRIRRNSCFAPDGGQQQKLRPCPVRFHHHGPGEDPRSPEIAANNTEAQLIHEAAIGKIAGDQLLKLQTLGMTQEEAEDRILKGFLA